MHLADVKPHRLRALVALGLTVGLTANACGVVGGGGGGAMQVTAYFTRAVSLFNDSQVRVLGLPAGSVGDVEVEGDVVRVELSVDEDVPVPADARATIVPFSLIGERYVQLFPAYTEGPRMKDGDVIPLDRTSVPVEPDEALVALRDLLDDLNPEATQRLTENLATDLADQGQKVNDLLRDLGGLTRELGSKSDALGRIIDHFDKFTATLVTREAQIGQVLDDFAVVTGVLADERDHLANVISNLAQFATDVRDLVEKHGTNLGQDLETLEHVAQSLTANLDAIADLLDATPMFATGLKNAYDATNRDVDLRDSGVFEGGGGGGLGGLGGAGEANAGGLLPGDGGDAGAEAAPTPPPPPQTPFAPLDELLRRLTERGAGPLHLSARRSDDRNGAERVAGGLVDFFGGLARSMVGVA